MFHESAVEIISEFLLVDIFHKFTYGFRDNDFWSLAQPNSLFVKEIFV